VSQLANLEIANNLADRHTYSCFNFRLNSGIVLDELSPAADPFDSRPVVDVRLGSLPEILPRARAAEFGLQMSADAVMLTVNDVARYLVRSGREMIVSPMPGAAERNVRLFLLGSALGILCHQRGLLPLHANAIVANRAAIAFAGPSGSGKSTLAAHFERAGYQLLCDDVCVIAFDEAGRPVAWPGLPLLKLWGDAAEQFGFKRADLGPAIEGMDKYHVPMVRSAPPRPIPFRRLYHLSRTEGGEPGSISRLRGSQAMAAVMAQTYRGIYLAPMSLRQRHFRLCAALLEHAEVYAASRAWGYNVFAREASALERHFAGPGEEK
jgi:hypothetical protein